MFEKIERFFKMKIYTVKQIRQFRDKGVITVEEFIKLTGEEC